MTFQCLACKQMIEFEGGHVCPPGTVAFNQYQSHVGNRYEQGSLQAHGHLPAGPQAVAFVSTLSLDDIRKVVREEIEAALKASGLTPITPDLLHRINDVIDDENVDLNARLDAGD
jgi:hypothetical protein